MSPALLALVAVGSGLGAQARYGLDRLVQRRPPGWLRPSVLPWGTLAVNVAGSLLLGALSALALEGHLDRGAQTVLAAGFSGSFTTFSTWTYETVRLVEDGAWGAAALNVVLSLVAGLAAAAAGFTALRWAV